MNRKKGFLQAINVGGAWTPGADRNDMGLAKFNSVWPLDCLARKFRRFRTHFSYSRQTFRIPMFAGMMPSPFRTICIPPKNYITLFFSQLCHSCSSLCRIVASCQFKFQKFSRPVYKICLEF